VLLFWAELTKCNKSLSLPVGGGLSHPSPALALKSGSCDEEPGSKPKSPLLSQAQQSRLSKKAFEL
jgi:hypothetical protein